MTMQKKNSKRVSVETITGLGVLTAIVIILQLLGSNIRVGTFSLSLVNVPVAVGAILFGLPGGLWLGFIFGAVVLLSGDANLFLAVNIPGTILTVLLKGMASGAAAAAVYRLFSEKGKSLAVVLASMACPVANTGVFLLGCLLFFMETVEGWAQAAGMPDRVGAYMILVLVGVNFLVEFSLSVLLASVTARVVLLVKEGIKTADRG